MLYLGKYDNESPGFIHKIKPRATNKATKSKKILIKSDRRFICKILVFRFKFKVNESFLKIFMQKHLYF